MCWDMTKEQRPPFQRTWVGSEVLEEKYTTENYIWAHNIGAVDLTPTLKDCGIINETYMLFKDRIFNYKTGDVYRPVNGVSACTMLCSVITVQPGSGTYTPAPES